MKNKKIIVGIIIITLLNSIVLFGTYKQVKSMKIEQNVTNEQLDEFNDLAKALEENSDAMNKIEVDITTNKNNIEDNLLRIENNIYLIEELVGTITQIRKILSHMIN